MATAHLYMQLQPDWRELVTDSEGDAGTDARCWLDVYERSVHLDNDSNCSNNATDAKQNSDNSDLLRVQIDASPSAHFALDLSTTSTTASGNTASSTSSSHNEHLVEVVKREQQWIEVLAHTHDQHHAPRTVRTTFQSPTAVMGNTSTSAQRQQLHTVDVSSDEKYVAVGGADGFCALYDAVTHTEAFVLPGHVADVTTTRFFPSGVVLLTGALDFTLRIWSVATGQCAAVLKGHRGGIADTAILGRGRNVLSCSSDGLIHLWACSTQQVIAKWSNDAQSAVHCLSVLDEGASSSRSFARRDETALPPAHDLEAETDGKVLFAGLANSETLGVDMRTRELVMSIRGTAPILSCAAASRAGAPVLFTGSDDGLLTTWDLRNTSAPLELRSRSTAPIHSIALAQSPTATTSTSVWTAHGDGVCCVWGDSVADGVLTQLTGPVYDPVRAVAVAPQTGRVFTAGRDGLVRDYIPHVIRA